MKNFFLYLNILILLHFVFRWFGREHLPSSFGETRQWWICNAYQFLSGKVIDLWTFIIIVRYRLNFKRVFKITQTQRIGEKKETQGKLENLLKFYINKEYFNIGEFSYLDVFLHYYFKHLKICFSMKTNFNQNFFIYILEMFIRA